MNSLVGESLSSNGYSILTGLEVEQQQVEVQYHSTSSSSGHNDTQEGRPTYISLKDHITLSDDIFQKSKEINKLNFDRELRQDHISDIRKERRFVLGFAFLFIIICEVFNLNNCKGSWVTYAFLAAITLYYFRYDITKLKEIINK